MAKTKRHDPPTTRVDGARRGDLILGKRPDYEYRLAHPTEDQFGVPALLADGWECVPKSADGERSAVPYRSDGEFVTGRGGTILMRKPKDLYLQQDVAPARAHTDQLEKSIIKRGGFDDPSRGMHRPGVSFDNESSALERAYGA